MMLLFTTVCLILGLITSGDAIQCTQCSSTSLPFCSGVTAACQSRHVCISIYEVTRIGYEETVQFTRGCGDKKMCDKFDTVTLHGSHYRLGSTCCDKDFCTPYNPPMPPASSPYNGRYCPYCQSTTSKDCKANQWVNCTGTENKCLLENRELTAGSYTQKSSVRGCATKGYCDLGTQKTEAGGVKMKIEVSCTNGANPNPTATLLLCAAFLIHRIF